MTVEELRKRVNETRPVDPRADWTRQERDKVIDLFDDVLQAIAHGSMSYGNARALADEALGVLE